MVYHGHMSKWYLAVRIVLLFALLFLLAAIFWGLANRESTMAETREDVPDRYGEYRPSGYTTVILITLVILGIFVVIASILFDFHRTREPGD